MSSKDLNNWQRALLPMLLLQELKAAPQHGYALGKALAERGFQPLQGATLYPALAKLESAELVRTEWVEGDGGPGKKIYALTDDGARHLTELRKQWGEFVGRVG